MAPTGVESRARLRVKEVGTRNVINGVEWHSLLWFRSAGRVEMAPGGRCWARSPLD